VPSHRRHQMGANSGLRWDNVFLASPLWLRVALSDTSTAEVDPGFQ
jgi:hypothetical protein